MQLPKHSYAPAVFGTHFFNECFALTELTQTDVQGPHTWCVWHPERPAKQMPSSWAHFLKRGLHLFLLQSCRQSQAVRKPKEGKNIFVLLWPQHDFNQSSKPNKVTGSNTFTQKTPYTNFNMLVHLVWLKENLFPRLNLNLCKFLIEFIYVNKMGPWWDPCAIFTWISMTLILKRWLYYFLNLLDYLPTQLPFFL